MTTTQPAALPEPTQEQLGTPAAHADYSLGWFNVGWARCMAERARDAMWAERLAALQPQPAAEVSDEEIIAIKKATKAADPTQPWGDTLAFARAILALRPQAVPIGRDDLKVLMSAAGYVHATAQEKADFINGFRNAEAHHGITAQGAQGGEG